MTALRVDHLSGRWDRSPDLLERQVEASAKKSDVIMTTEVSSDKRASVLNLPGWTLGRDTDGDMGEIGIVSRDAVWAVVVGMTYVLGPDLGPGGRVVARVQLLRHVETGATLLVSAAHLPATVESGWAARTKRAVAHQRAVQQWRGIVRRWRKRHKPDGELITADWNLNLHRAWVRAWIRPAWPALHLPKRIPPGGTHAGGRLIDWPLGHRIPDLAFTILPGSPASDHRGIRVRGTITKRKERR